MEIRIDYVKLIYRFPPGTRAMQEVRDHLDMVEAEFRGTARGLGLEDAKTWRTSTDYSSKETNAYVFEAWGKVADHWFKSFAVAHPAEAYQRVDYRIELHEGFDPRTLEGGARSRGRRNFQSFNGKPRSKLGDRDAGGYGLAKGSHKSRRRIVVYKRGKENPAIELQLRQDSAKDVIKRVKIAFEKDQGRYAIEPYLRPDYFYQLVLDALYDEMREDAQDELDVDLSTLINLSDSDIMDENEKVLAEIDRLFATLPKEAQTAFFQAKLFPDDAFSVE